MFYSLLYYITTINALIYNNRPIFVTGGTSKLGKSVVSKLSSNGIKIRCLIRNNENIEDLFENYENVELVKGDILDYSTLEHIMKGCKKKH